METTLMIVGKELHVNKLYMQYLKRNIDLHVKGVKKEVLLSKDSIDILEELKHNILTSDSVVIVANKESFNLVSKVLCTFGSDELKYDNNMLMPSRAHVFCDSSYLVNISATPINVLHVKQNEELPKILLRAQKSEDSFFVMGMDKDTITILLSPLVDTFGVKVFAYEVVDGCSSVHVSAMNDIVLEQFLKSVAQLFSGRFVQGDNLAQFVVEKMSKKGKKITMAESCTGGLIASMITKIPGASAVLDGSVVSYSGAMKTKWAKVDTDTIKIHGEVSELCVREMLEGMIGACGADFSIAVSGVAGPSGGSSAKPVGTVFVGARSREGRVAIERVLLRGDREHIQLQSAYVALRLLLEVGEDIFWD